MPYIITMAFLILGGFPFVQYHTKTQHLRLLQQHPISTIATIVSIDNNCLETSKITARYRTKCGKEITSSYVPLSGKRERFFIKIGDKFEAFYAADNFKAFTISEDVSFYCNTRIKQHKKFCNIELYGLVMVAHSFLLASL